MLISGCDCCVKTNIHTFIFRKHTQTAFLWATGLLGLHCISAGVSFPFVSPNYFHLSLSLKLSDKGKTRKKKSHPCYQWCSRTHLQKAADLINRDHICEQNVNSNMEAFAKGLIKQFLLVKGRPATQLQSGGKSACRNIKDICTSGDAYIWPNKRVQKKLGK